jgi:glycopeptide antibiotics resistance protein
MKIDIDNNSRLKRIKIVKSIVALIVFIAYTILLFISLTMNLPSEITLSQGADKIIHFILFFIFAILLFFVLDVFGIKRMFIIGSIIGILISIIFEFTQLNLNYRTFSFYDIVANILGFMIGMGVYKWIFFRQ